MLRLGCDGLCQLALARYVSPSVAKMVDEVSVCVCKCVSSSALSVSGVRVSLTVKTHTHINSTESPGMDDTDTCLSLRRLAGFLSSENGRLFPRSQPDPSAAFISLSPSLSP